MSKYTTQLRWIVEEKDKGQTIPPNQRYSDALYSYIGLSDYPIFDASYRTALNDKIIDHFYFREIGFETAAQFAWYMRRTMNEIMPKYNALYRAQATIDLDHPLSDYVRHRIETWQSHVDDDSQRSRSTTDETHANTTDTVNETAAIVDTVDTEYTKEIHSSGASSDESSDSSNTSGTNSNRNVFQDTPMSLLKNDGSGLSIEGLDYATTVTYDNGTDSSQTASESERSGTTSNDTVETMDSVKTDERHEDRDRTGTRTDAKTQTGNMTDASQRDKDDEGERLYDEYGNNRSWAALMEEFAEKWQNIDMMVINDLEDLFFGLW